MVELSSLLGWAARYGGDRVVLDGVGAGTKARPGWAKGCGTHVGGKLAWYGGRIGHPPSIRTFKLILLREPECPHYSGLEKISHHQHTRNNLIPGIGRRYRVR